MAFSVTIAGFPVSCETPQDVLLLIERAKGTAAPVNEPEKRGPGRPPNSSAIKDSSRRDELENMADLLSAIESSEDGVNAGQIVEAMNLKGPRGVGGALLRSKRILTDLEFNPNDVFTKQEQGADPPVWVRGKRINDALTKISHLLHPGKNGH